MPTRFEKFVHDENVKNLKMRLAAEFDPVRERTLQALLKAELDSEKSDEKPG